MHFSWQFRQCLCVHAHGGTWGSLLSVTFSLPVPDFFFPKPEHFSFLALIPHIEAHDLSFCTHYLKYRVVLTGLIQDLFGCSYTWLRQLCYLNTVYTCENIVLKMDWTAVASTTSCYVLLLKTNSKIWILYNRKWSPPEDKVEYFELSHHKALVRKHTSDKREVFSDLTLSNRKKFTMKISVTVSIRSCRRNQC